MRSHSAIARFCSTRCTAGLNTPRSSSRNSSPEANWPGYVFATTRHDYFTRAAHAHVEVIAVTREAERRGVARLLMEAIEQWARRRGYRHLTLNVFDRNTRAKALYDSLGYQVETVHYRKTLP